MKQLISIAIAALAATSWAVDYNRHDEIVAQYEAAKAACPNCYRVVITNGVVVGMDYATYTNYVVQARPPRKIKAKARGKISPERKEAIRQRLKAGKRSKRRVVTLPHRSRDK